MSNRQNQHDDGLSHSAAHYLMAMQQLLAKYGYVRGSDVARSLGVTRGSVSVTMRSLCSAGLVEQDDNRFFHLTAAGQESAAAIAAKHMIIEHLLQDVLKISPDKAHRESCRVEYLVEDETARRLINLLILWRKRRLDDALQKELDAPCRMAAAVGTACPCSELSCLGGDGDKHAAAGLEGVSK